MILGDKKLKTENLESQKMLIQKRIDRTTNQLGLLHESISQIHLDKTLKRKSSSLCDQMMSDLEKELSSGNVDKKLFAEKSKEYSNLNEIINDAKVYLSYSNEKIELNNILEDKNSDEELIKMAKSELDNLKVKFDNSEKKLKLFLLPKDDADKKNAIIEIRAGTGGLEASLFAADLFKMYEKVSHKKKWILELISISKSEAGGLKEVIASIKGTNIYSTLKYESGVHRVQRVPDTETQGRVHTSAATVAVLPEAEEVDLKNK